MVEGSHSTTKPIQISHTVTSGVNSQDRITGLCRVEENPGARIATATSTVVLGRIVLQHQPPGILLADCSYAGIVTLDAVFTDEIKVANVRFSIKTYPVLAISNIVEAIFCLSGSAE